MIHKMPCSISDGPQYEGGERFTPEPDEDAEYEAIRQQEIDDEERENGTNN